MIVEGREILKRELKRHGCNYFSTIIRFHLNKYQNWEVI